MHYFEELGSILNEMSPYLIFGFLISGLLHVYVPRSIYSKFLHRKGFASVIGAALLGVPLPLCSCGVIPTAVSLKKEGASDGATVAFLVGTPQTGIDSILATYSLLGLPFAIIRPVAAFVVAIFGGVMVDSFTTKRDYTKVRFAPQNNPCECGCNSSHNHKTSSEKGGFLGALKYGYVDMMQDFGKWLVIGLLIAAAITAFVPDSAFSMFKDHYLLNLLLILAISAPMYVCATGSIPIALSLIMKGVSPGAAFVLLMAGPATNVASLIVLHREIGMRKTIIYLAAIIIGAVACALVIDYLLPQEWFAGLVPHHDALHEPLHDHHDMHHELHHESYHEPHDHCTHGPIWWQSTTSVIFVALFINAMIRKFRHGEGCCTH